MSVRAKAAGVAGRLSQIAAPQGQASQKPWVRLGSV